MYMIRTCQKLSIWFSLMQSKLASHKLLNNSMAIGAMEGAIKALKAQNETVKEFIVTVKED